MFKRVGLAGLRFVLTRCQVVFFKRAFIHSLSASLYKDDRCFPFARWSLLFGSSLAIFYQSSCHPMPSLDSWTRAVLYIHWP